MSEQQAPNSLLAQLTATIEQNLSNGQFGVSELADAMNMSRSNLLRKVKKETRLSVSQLISQVRLKRAMELLRKKSLNISEVADQVGFASTSYFTKCFREYYGYPPSEVGLRDSVEPAPVGVPPNRVRPVAIAAISFLTICLLVGAYWFWTKTETTVVEKSIAVLPFKNDSSDSTNVYLINGLMESTINNLQKIKDLRVISRTSAEKYRFSSKSIPEMAEELNVRYFVEGSGQKVGDQIVLTIQLIDGETDNHLWSNQYRREASDIFQLQQEVARSIAEEIRAIITPEEDQHIRKKLTENLVAYDLYLKGIEVASTNTDEDRLMAVELFRKAIDEDPEFAAAYAQIVFNYYEMDYYLANKKYTEEITLCADKAILYDGKLGESLVAKALSMIQRKEYEAALPYLEKAFEYYPGSADIVGLLTDHYAFYVLNTSKYLEYALRGIRLDPATMDSVQASFAMLRLGNALIQTGFVDEALKYIDKSIEYNPENPWSRYVRAFILYAKNGDIRNTRSLLIEEYNKDTTRFDILQDIGKVTYYMRDYEGAYQYYKKFLDFRESGQLDVYRHENMIIGTVLAKVGMKEKSEELIQDYKEYIDADRSSYKHLGLSVYYTSKGDQQKAIEHMKLFSKEDNIQYWVILFLGDEPLLDPIIENPEFRKYFDESKQRFWKTHEELRQKLVNEGLL